MSDTGIRMATFAGYLGFGDATISGDGETPLVAIRVEKGTVMDGGPAMRPGRRYTTETAGWSPEAAGHPADDLCRRYARESAPAAAERAGLPSGPLEVWLMPVVTFSFDFLIIAAG